MKRPIAFSTLFWIPLIFGIVFFWMRHLDGNIAATAVPLLERIHAISPGALITMIIALIAASAWTLVLWATHNDNKELHFRPLTIGLWWLLMVMVMGLLSFGDIWQMTALPITEAEKAQILLREFGLRDPLVINGFVMFGQLLSNVFIGVIALLILVLGALGVGTWMRRLLPQDLAAGEILLLLLGAGFAGWIFGLTVLGLFGALQPILVTSLLVLAVAIAVFREGKFLGRQLLEKKPVTWTKREGYLQPFFVVGLMLVLAASFLHILRPIPIGWDDIGVYMNIPSLTAQHGALIGGFGAYSWGLIMSLGFLVWQTPYVAMLYSLMGGVLAFFGLNVVLHHLHRKEKPSSVPLFLVTAFAMAPFVLFQLGEDMKIDLALLFMGTVATLIATLLWRRETLRRWPWFAFLGVIIGTAVGIKMTAVLLAVMVMGIVLLRLMGGWALAALLAWSLVFFFGANIFALGGLTVASDVRIIAMILSAVAAVVTSVLAYLRSPARKQAVSFLVITILAAGIAFLPWMVFNLRSWCAVQCPPLSLNMLIYSQAGGPTLPAQAAVAISPTATGTVLKQELQTQGGTITEELGRYAGFDQSVMHYISLPFDSSFSLNVAGDYVTVGWVFLGLLLLGAAWGVTQHADRSRPRILYGMAAAFLVWVIYGSLAPVPEASQLLVHVVTVGFAVLIIALLVYAARRNHDPESLGEEIKTLLQRRKVSLLTQAPLTLHIAIMTVVYGFLWMYLASGVIWYGIVGVIGILAIGTAALEQMRDDEEGKSHYTLFIILLLIFWILPMFAYKMTTSDTSIKRFAVEKDSVVSSQLPVKSYDTRHFVLFKGGVLNQDTGLQFFNAEYYAAAKLLNGEKQSKIFRIGTLLPYFVQSNDTRIATDNQLDQFIASYLPEEDPMAFAKRLYEAGYRYIVFDLGTESIDKTEAKTLTKKVDIFQSFINNNHVNTPQYDATGVRLFTQTHPLLKEELRGGSFIIWSLQQPK